VQVLTFITARRPTEMPLINEESAFRMLNREQVNQIPRQCNVQWLYVCCAGHKTRIAL